MDVDRKHEVPSEADRLPAVPTGMVRRQHHPGMFWLGMVMMVTLAYVLGAFNR